MKNNENTDWKFYIAEKRINKLKMRISNTWLRKKERTRRFVTKKGKYG